MLQCKAGLEEDRNREQNMGFWSWTKNGKGVENALPRSTSAAKHKKERTSEHTFIPNSLPLSSFHLKSMHPQPAFNDFF